MANGFRMAPAHKGNCRQDILHFTLSKVVGSGAESDTAKIEAQHFATETEEGLGSRKNHFVVHRALVQRMRMANHRQRHRIRSFPELQETFDASRGPIELNTLDFIHVLAIASNASRLRWGQTLYDTTCEPGLRTRVKGRPV